MLKAILPITPPGVAVAGAGARVAEGIGSLVAAPVGTGVTVMFKDGAGAIAVKVRVGVKKNATGSVGLGTEPGPKKK